MLTEVYITTYQSDKAVRYMEFIESELLKDDREGKDVEGSKSKLSLFKARLSLLHGNVKACKRDIKNFSTLAGNVNIFMIVAKYHQVVGGRKRQAAGVITRSSFVSVSSLAIKILLECQI